MTLKKYGEPVLTIVSISEKDIICESNYENMDVLQPDSGIWD